MCTPDQDFHTKYENGFDNGEELQLQLNILEKICQKITSDGKVLRVMTIGPGPCTVTKPFIEMVLPFAEEIVLVEVNSESCKNYEESDWYKKDQQKIKIICSKYEDFIRSGTYPESHFDLIWCSQVLYFWRLDELAEIMRRTHSYLRNRAIAAIIFANENSPDIQAYKWLTPSYRHHSTFAKILEQGDFSYDKSTYDFQALVPMETFSLLLEYDVLRHADYRNIGHGALTEEQRTELDSSVRKTMETNHARSKNMIFYKGLLDCYLIYSNTKTKELIGQCIEDV